MAKIEKLLEKAKNAPHNLRFEELCALAVGFGWKFKRQRGTSHRLYENPELRPEQGRRMNFQSDSGKAKSYQITQLLNAIEELE